MVCMSSFIGSRVTVRLRKAQRPECPPSGPLSELPKVKAFRNGPKILTTCHLLMTNRIGRTLTNILCPIGKGIGEASAVTFWQDNVLRRVFSSNPRSLSFLALFPDIRRILRQDIDLIIATSRNAEWVK